jgi:chromosome segregation ATPase
MASRNDPAKLEAEANALVEQYKKAQEESLKANAQEDTPPQPEPEEVQEETPPEEPQETEAEVKAKSDEDDGASKSDDNWKAQLAKAEDRYKNAQSRMTKAIEEAKAAKQTSETLANRIALLEQELAQKQEVQGPDPEIEALERDYPDIAKPLLKQLQKLQSDLKQTAQLYRKSEEERTLELHVSAVKAKHPDFADIAGDDGFQTWLDGQTGTWKRIAKNGTAEEVIELLDRFKSVTNSAPKVDVVSEAKKLAEPKLPKARNPNVGNKRVWTRAEIQGLNRRDYERLEAEIDKAWAEGRVR